MNKGHLQDRQEKAKSLIDEVPSHAWTVRFHL